MTMGSFSCVLVFVLFFLFLLGGGGGCSPAPWLFSKITPAKKKTLCRALQDHARARETTPRLIQRRSEATETPKASTVLHFATSTHQKRDTSAFCEKKGFQAATTICRSRQRGSNSDDTSATRDEHTQKATTLLRFPKATEVTTVLHFAMAQTPKFMNFASPARNC